MAYLNFHGENFAGGYKIAKFMKVFPSKVKFPASWYNGDVTVVVFCKK